MSILLDNRHAQKGPPSPVPHGKNLTQLFTMGRVQPQSLGNRGGTWYFFAFSFPLYPRNRCITEPFCPCFAPESVCFRACLSPTCTGIGKTCHRVATETVSYHHGIHMMTPPPLHGIGTACGTLDSPESVATV